MPSSKRANATMAVASMAAPSTASTRNTTTTIARRSSRAVGIQVPEAPQGEGGCPGCTTTKSFASTTARAQKKRLHAINCRHRSQPQLSFSVVCCSCASAERLSCLLFDSLTLGGTSASVSDSAGSNQGKDKGNGTKKCKNCQEPFCRDCLWDSESWAVQRCDGTLVEFRD